MKEYFTEEDLMYIKETQKEFGSTIKDERRDYKTKIDNHLSYSYFSKLSKKMTKNRIIKRGRCSFIRGGGRSKIHNRDIKYIQGCLKNEYGYNTVKNLAKALGISVSTINKYRRL